MDTVRIGDAEVTRLIIGGNQFSGFSHQNYETDLALKHYYTTERIKEVFRLAEAAGVTTFIGRSDHHIQRILMEYWDEGGKIQWIAQSSSEVADQLRVIRSSATLGAVGAFLHGGVVDHWYTQGRHDELREAVAVMRECGVAAGMAAHMPHVHEWMRDHLDLDFHMCCHYDPVYRGDNPHHVPGLEEKWDPADRDRMAAVIATIERPVIHYKVMAAANRPIEDAFAFLPKAMRPGDAVCIGHDTRENRNMIAENVRMIEERVEAQWESR